MGLEAGRRPQIVLEFGRLYNIQRRSSLPATELGVFGRTSSGASDKFVSTSDASGVPRGREPNLGGSRAPAGGSTCSRGREPNLGGAVLPQGEALLTASVGRGIAGLHLIELLRSQG